MIDQSWLPENIDCRCDQQAQKAGKACESHFSLWCAGLGAFIFPVMFFKNDDSSSQTGDGADAEMSDKMPYEVVEGNSDAHMIFLCDHASNYVPLELAGLGLNKHVFDRHIAYDIGVAELTRGLAAHFGAPAVLSKFSRLLIDPNRGEDDPTLIMRLSDGAAIPANSRLDEAAGQDRLRQFYHPYHQAVSRVIDQALSRDTVPVLISIHSFTPAWKGISRPWHSGILWDKDPRFAQPLIAALKEPQDITVGDNQPYSGALRGDCLYRHGTSRGLAHGLVEVRQDLIGDGGGVEEWRKRLARAIEKAMTAKDLHKIIHYGSYSD